MERDHWQLGLLVREALRNVFGSGSRLLPVVALAVALGAGSSAFIAMETRTMHEQVTGLAADGRNVLVFSALNDDAPARIDRRSCEALTGQHGITQAGILERVGEVDVFPVGTNLPAQRASTTLFPELSGTDLLVGPRLSDHAPRPFTVRIDDHLATAIPTPPHPDGLATGSTITLPPHPGASTAERCVVVMDAFSDARAALPVVAAQLSVLDNPISGTELLTATSDPALNYLERFSRWMPLALGLLGAIATAIVTRLRSSELAVYRMSGTSPTSLMTLLTLETLLIAGIAALSAATASLA